jgi:hypothetical protein
MVFEPAIVARGKITQFVLSAHIYPAIGSYLHRAYNGFIGEGIQVPVPAVEAQQPLVIGKVNDAIFVLLYIPVLQPGAVGLLGIIDHIRQADSILAICTQWKTKQQEQFSHFSANDCVVKVSKCG